MAKPYNHLKELEKDLGKLHWIRQLWRWENQIDQGGSRSEKLKRIAEYTLNCFTEALEKGIIHDIDIARWASRAQEEENVSEFEASET